MSPEAGELREGDRAKVLPNANSKGPRKPFFARVKRIVAAQQQHIVVNPFDDSSITLSLGENTRVENIVHDNRTGS